MSESSTRTGAIASEIRRLVGIPETTIYTGDMDTCFMEAVKRIEALERERDGFREILNENEEERARAALRQFTLEQENAELRVALKRRIRHCQFCVTPDPCSFCREDRPLLGEEAR